MKNSSRIVYGLIITFAIFSVAMVIGSQVHLNNEFIANSVVGHTLMLVFAIIAIIVMRKQLSYNISFPAFKTILKPIALGLVVTIAINILMTVLTKHMGAKVEAHPLLLKMNPIQVFLSVFFYASVAEEILFRGFLMNFLKPLNTAGIKFFNRRISIPVILSAIAFGLAHLILIRSGVNSLFLIRIVLFTACLGLIAGYYQEKYDNNAYAIVVHMAGNFTALIGAIVMSM